MHYSIKDLERISGFKAHTLRIWEKRYDLLTPERTGTNIRAYGDDDLRKLLNVKTLLDGGWKISRVGELSLEALQAEVKRNFEAAQAEGIDFSPYVNALMTATYDLDEGEFDKIFAAAVTRFGLKDTMTKVVNPFLRQVGMMWSVWEVHPGHEHFASNVIRRKLFAAIDQVLPFTGKKEKFLLFLPEWEGHEIGLLFANYWLRSEGFEVIHLGQQVPFESLADVVEKKKPHYLMTFFTSSQAVEDLNAYLKKLTERFENQHFFIAGEKSLLGSLEERPGVTKLFNPEDFFTRFGRSNLND